MRNNPGQPLDESQKPPSEISETIEIKRPLVPNTGDGQQQIYGDGLVSQKISANPLDEYVSGGGYVWLAKYIKALPFYVDDLSRDLGDDIYDRMLLDPKISAAMNIRKGAVLAQGIDILPAQDEEETQSTGSIKKKSSNKAKEIADFCKRCLLDNLKQRPIHDVVFEMLDALALGHKLGELIYTIPTRGKLANTLALKAIKVKPRRSTAIVVDVYYNTIGVIGLIPGQGAPVIVESILGDPASIPNILPREKFAVLSHRMKNNDPRGSSDLRQVYNPWWVKQQTWGEYLKFITQFASPSVAGYTADGAMTTEQIDAQGNIKTDTNGNPIIVTPEQAMLLSLQNLRNGSAGAFPFGSKVDMLQPRGEGAPFQNAFDLCNSEIITGILYQTLATEEGKHMARAASETHQDILGLLVRLDKKECSDMIREDIIKPLVRYNFGEEAAEDLLPTVSLGETEHQDFEAIARAIASLVQSGYLHYSQYQGVDQMLSLPERDMTAQLREIEEERAQVDPATLAADQQQQISKQVAKDNGKKVAGRIESGLPQEG